MKGMVLDAVWEPKPTYQVSEWEEKTGKAITGNSIWRHPKLGVRDWPDPEPGHFALTWTEPSDPRPTLGVKGIRQREPGPP